MYTLRLSAFFILYHSVRHRDMPHIGRRPRGAIRFPLVAHHGANVTLLFCDLRSSVDSEREFIVA